MEGLEWCETEQGQDPVDNGRLGMVGALEAGIHQKAHGSNHCHMKGTVYQGDRRSERRSVQMISGNQKTKDVEKFCHFARKFPGGGFLIQFLHDFLRLGFQFLLGLLVQKFMFRCGIVVSSIIDVFLFHQNTSFSQLPD